MSEPDAIAQRVSDRERRYALSAAALRISALQGERQCRRAAQGVAEHVVSMPQPIMPARVETTAVIASKPMICEPGSRGDRKIAADLIRKGVRAADARAGSCTPTTMKKEPKF